MLDPTPQPPSTDSPPREPPAEENHPTEQTEGPADNVMDNYQQHEQYSSQVDDADLSSEDDSEDNIEKFSYGQIYAHQQLLRPPRPQPNLEELQGVRPRQRMPLGQADGIKQVAGTSRLPLVADSENIQPAVASDASSHVHTAPHALSNTSTFDSTVTQKEDNTGLIRRKAQHVPPTPASAAEQSSIQQHRESAEQTLDQQTAVESISDTRSVHHAGPANIMHQTTSHTVHPNGAVNQLQQTLQEHDSTITADNQDDLYSAEPGIAQPGINDIMDALLSRFQQEELLRSQEEDKKLKWQEQAMREQAKQEDLRTQLSTLQQETEEAKAAVQQQKTKIAKSETKVTKLRSFITGLGNDMESLKKKANADRQDSEQVFNAQGERQAELEGLLTEMSSRVGKSTQLQNEAMKLCRESKAELTAAILRSTHLEKQLEAKSRQLVEEKEHREQIQSQLASVTTSHEAMNRELVSSRDTVLDKLGEIEIILDESDNREKVADMIDKTFQAVKGGNAQQASALDDILSLKGMVENLSESLSALPQRSSTEAEQVKSLKECFDNAFEGIKADLLSQEEAALQQTSDRKTIEDLQADLRNRDARILEITLQLTNAREAVTELTSQKAIIQEKVTKLENDIAATADDHEQLQDIREKLAERDLALSTTKSNAELQARELGSLTASNADLRKRLDELELQLQEAPTNPCLDQERLELKRKTANDVEKVRQQMSEQASTFHASEKSKAENIQKALRSECEKSRGEVQGLKQELASAKIRIQDLENQNNAQLAVPKLLADSQKEVKEMRLKMASLEQDSRSTAATMKELESVRSQLAACQQCIGEITTEKDTLKEDIVGLQQSTQSAKSSEEKTKKQLEQDRTTNRDAIKALELEIQASKDASIRGVKLAEEARQAAINEEKARHKSELDTIQQRLDASEDALREAAEAAEYARTEEREVHKKSVTELSSRVLEVEPERDELLAELETARNEVANTRTGATLSSRPSEGPGPSLAKEIGLIKKRKVLDRNNNSHARLTAQDDMILRRPESSARPTAAALRGPVIPESQPDNLPLSTFPQDELGENYDRPTGQVGDAETAARVPPPGVRDADFPEGPFAEGSQLFGSQPSGQMSHGLMVQESQQFDDEWPTSRGPVVQESQQPEPASQTDNCILRSEVAEKLPETFSDVMEDMLDVINEEHSIQNALDTQVNQGQFVFPSHHSLQQSQRVPESPTFKQPVGRRSDPFQPSRGPSRSSLHEPEVHVFKKIMPPPNSSSKRVRPDTGDSSLSSGSRGQHQRANACTTPEPKGLPTVGIASMRGKARLPSSSPAFLNKVKDGRHASTYSEKVGHSYARSTSNPKRKASSQDVTGHEPERKRRTDMTTKTGAASQPAPRTSSQMMASDRPSSQTGKLSKTGASSIGGRTLAPARVRGQGNSQPMTTQRQTRSRKTSMNKEMRETFARHSR